MPRGTGILDLLPMPRAVFRHMCYKLSVIKAFRAFELGHPKMHMPDTDAGVDRLGAKSKPVTQHETDKTGGLASV